MRMYTYLHRIIFNYITYKCFVTMDNIEYARPFASADLTQGYV